MRCVWIRIRELSWRPFGTTSKSPLLTNFENYTLALTSTLETLGYRTTIVLKSSSFIAAELLLARKLGIV